MPLVSSKQMLVRARKERYAVGAFNAENMEMVKAIISASEECLSPVIIQTTPSAIEYGGYDLFFAMVSSLAKHSKVDVALHLDHAETLESVIKAVKAGYTSVMIDGSKKTFIENIKITKQVVEYCHPLSIPVEAELGGIAGRVGFEHVDLSFTDPLIAEDFVNKTNVDSLAVAIGTVHGFYHSKPNLDFDRLKEISNRINIPIVLHGASGLSDEQIKKAVRFGVNKINIATELRTSFTSTIKEYFKVHDDVFDLRKYGKKAIESVQNVVKEKLLLLGSCGKCLSIKPKAFVFDLDGTIVDSEKYFFEAYKKAFLFYGFEIGDKALEFRSLDRELATKLCNSITSNTISYSIS